MKKFLEKIAAVVRWRKNARKNTRDGIRGRQPVFTSRSATMGRKPDGLIGKVRSWFRRSSRRKELKQAPVVPGKKLGERLAPVLLLVFLVVAAVMVYGPLKNAVAGMKFFRIREISITGCRVTNPTLIRELAGVRYQGSMLDLDVKHMKAILKTHPWIAVVEIKRGWPDVLEIAVKEYAAEALIAQEGAGERQFYYLDRNGAVFAPVEAGQDMDFPVITGVDVKKDAGSLTALLGDALQLLKYVRQNNPNLPVQNLSEIHVDRDAGMTIYLADYPFPIYFGAGEVRTKYSRLKRVLEVLYKETEQGETIADVAYIRMDYQENKVLVAHSGSG